MSKPSFIIIGTPRSGTTSSVAHLRQHPNIHVLNQLNFFNFDKDGCSGAENSQIGYNSGIEEYEKYFISGGRRHRGLPRGCKKKCLGERTAGYYRSDKAIERIKENYPNIKIIVFLREPISRAYSLWNKNVRKGSFRQSFLEWMKDELCFSKNIDLSYGDRLKLVFDLFPRNNICISISEKVLKSPILEYNKIFNFLGEKEFRGLKFDNTINKNIYDAPLSRKDFLYLYNNFYKSYNTKLYELLGYRVKEWGRAYK